MAGTLVQSRSTHGNGAAPTLAFVSNVTAGNLIIVSAAVFQNTISTPTHTGDTFTRIGTGALNGNSRLEGYYAPNAVGGATTITFHFGSACDYGITIEEWSGAPTTSPQDGSASSGTGTSLAPDGGNVTTSAANGFLWSACTHGGAGTVAIGEGTNFSLGTEQESTANMPIHTENRGQGGGLAASTYATPHTLDSSQAWAALSAAFKTTGGGGGTATQQFLTLLGVGT